MFAEIGEAIRDGGTWSGEIEMVDQDGERHPMSGVAVGIRDEQGHLEGFAVTYRGCRIASGSRPGSPTTPGTTHTGCPTVNSCSTC